MERPKQEQAFEALCIRPESLDSSAQLFGYCLSLHDYFQTYIWHNKPALHQTSHPRAVRTAALHYIDYMNDDSSRADPLGLREDYIAWNWYAQKPLQLDWNEFRNGFAMESGGHDLGNILGTLRIVHGKIIPHFLPSYIAANAENRSVACMQTLIQHSAMDDAEKKKYLPFVSHLILCTVFHPDDSHILIEEGRLLRRAAEVFDQIGSNLFDPDRNGNAETGLLQELISWYLKRKALAKQLTKEEPLEPQMVPDTFFNFAHRRLVHLVPDLVKRQQLLTIWQKELPREIYGFPATREPMITYLQGMQTSEGLPCLEIADGEIVAIRGLHRKDLAQHTNQM